MPTPYGHGASRTRGGPLNPVAFVGTSRKPVDARVGRGEGRRLGPGRRLATGQGPTATPWPRSTRRRGARRPPMAVSAYAPPRAQGPLGDDARRRHAPSAAPWCVRRDAPGVRGRLRVRSISRWGRGALWQAQDTRSLGPEISRRSLWTPQDDTSARWAHHGGTVSNHHHLGGDSPSLGIDAPCRETRANHARAAEGLFMALHA